jgi:hypothetical protein
MQFSRFSDVWRQRLGKLPSIIFRVINSMNASYSYSPYLIWIWRGVFEQDFIEHIVFGAVHLDIVHRVEQGLFQIIKIGIPRFDVGEIEFEDFESDVKVFNTFFTGVVLQDFFTGAADAFFADVGDGLITGFIGFGFFVTGFGGVEPWCNGDCRRLRRWGT